jgi:hypothetical protein
MRKKIIFIAGVGLASAAVLAVFFAQRDEFATSIRTTGVVEGTEANISSMITGKVKWLSHRPIGLMISDREPAAHLTTVPTDFSKGVGTSMVSSQGAA